MKRKPLNIPVKVQCKSCRCWHTGELYCGWPYTELEKMTAPDPFSGLARTGGGQWIVCSAYGERKQEGR